MNWRKIRLVIRREYVFNFKRPSFLFTAFGIPLISLGAMFLIGYLIEQRETDLNNFQYVSYIDRAGIVTFSVSDTYQPVRDPSLEKPTQSGNIAVQTAYFEALQQSATQQLLDNELDAFFVINDTYTLSGQVDVYARRNVPEVLQGKIEDFLWQQIAARAPDDLPIPIARVGMAHYTIRDLDSGDELSEAAIMGRMMLPFIFVMIYFMATSTTAQFLMGSIVEEKENRLMEILATSLRPSELLWGKLLGLGALALTQVTLWSVGGLLIVAINDDAQSFVSGAVFQTADIILVVVLFLINFFVFAASMLGIGASVTAEAESRQIAGFFTFLSVLPITLLVTFLSNPNGLIPMILTFFPLTAALALIMRLGMTTLPTWQIVLSITIQVFTVIVVMWLSAKVFRLGMLMYGKSLTPRTLWHALREGRSTLTTTTTDYDAPGANTRPMRKRKGLLRR